MSNLTYEKLRELVLEEIGIDETGNPLEPKVAAAAGGETGGVEKVAGEKNPVQRLRAHSGWGVFKKALTQTFGGIDMSSDTGVIAFAQLVVLLSGAMGVDIKSDGGAKMYSKLRSVLGSQKKE